MAYGKLVSNLRNLAATHRVEATKFNNRAHQVVSLDPSKGESDPQEYSRVNTILANFCDELADSLDS